MSVQNISLSNPERAALRRVISAHPGWPSYRIASGVTLDKLSTGACIACARSLGIDVEAVVSEYRAGNPSISKRTAFIGWAQSAQSRHDPEGYVAPVGATQQSSMTGSEFEELNTRLGRVEDATTSHHAALAVHDQTLTTMVAQIAALDARTPRVVHIAVGNAEPVNLGAVHLHPQFSTLLAVCVARDAFGFRQNVWLAGPTGSGKTTAARQVAKALGLAFYFHGAMTQAYELHGFVSPVSGVYHETPFVTAFRNGGVCLLDECDAGANEAVLAINAPLANGIMSLPDGSQVERHPDFICIGAGNTFGEGPSATYIGRARLDAAFMSRFPAKLFWGYDTDLEASICGDAFFARRVQAARRCAAENEFKVVIDPRHSIAGAALLASGMALDVVEELTFLSVLSVEQKATIRRSLRGL